MAKTPKRHFEFRRLIRPGAHWVWLSIALYVWACFLPAMPGIFFDNKITGWECLVSMVYVLPGWWANPAYFIALILYWSRRHRAATIFAAIAALLAISFQLMDVPNYGWAMVDQEVGCHMWIASLQLLAWNLLWREWITWRQRQEPLSVGLDERLMTNIAPTTSVRRSSSPLPHEPLIERSPE